MAAPTGAVYAWLLADGGVWSRQPTSIPVLGGTYSDQAYAGDFSLVVTNVPINTQSTVLDGLVNSNVVPPMPPWTSKQWQITWTALQSGLTRASAY